MTLSVIPVPDGELVPRDPEVVSPELALVDPVLAQAARARLTDRDGASPPKPDSEAQVKASPEALVALANAALEAADELDVSKMRVRRPWPLLAGVAALTILGLLLFDVRVEVGKTPASAEAPELVRTAEPVAPSRQPREASVPSRHPKLRRNLAEKVAPRRFAWAPTAGARGYHVELFRGAARVFSADTTRPELTIPARWKQDGKERSLLPGEYRWYVWPVVARKRAPNATVRAKLSVS